MPKRPSKTAKELIARLRAAELRRRGDAVVEIVDQAVEGGQWSFDLAGSFRGS